MTEHTSGLVLVGVIIIQALLLALQGRAHEREMRDQRAQLDRALLLGRAESLEQFAAVEARAARVRLEEARGSFRGADEGQVVAPKKPSTLDLLWRRHRPAVEDHQGERPEG